MYMVNVPLSDAVEEADKQKDGVGGGRSGGWRQGKDRQPQRAGAGQAVGRQCQAPVQQVGTQAGDALEVDDTKSMEPINMMAEVRKDPRRLPILSASAPMISMPAMTPVQHRKANAQCFHTRGRLEARNKAGGHTHSPTLASRYSAPEISV